MSFNFVATSSPSDLKVTVLHAKWKANIVPGLFMEPRRHPTSTSTPFRFLNNDWTLQLQDYGSSRDLYLVSGKASGFGTVPAAASPPAELFVVSVHVESATTGQVLQALTSTMRICSGIPLISIWKRSTMEMQLASPEFRTNSELKFILVFETTGKNSTSALSSSVPPVQTTSSVPCLESLSEDLSKLLEQDSTSALSSSVPPMQTTSSVSCLESLSEDFSKLLEQGQNNPDIEFQCGGKSTKAHGDVVSSRSQVIAKMLTTDMVEGRTKVVRIPDLKPDIFEKFLRYLYTGKLDKLTFEVALDLFEAGDQYAVTGLVKRCSKYLVEHLSMQNACAVLVIADAHSNEGLVEKVADYMVHNRVVAREDWPAFCGEHPRLANKVLNHVVAKFL